MGNKKGKKRKKGEISKKQLEELWSLDWTLAKYIHPRLVLYKEYTAGRPGCVPTEEEWHTILDKMVYSMGRYAEGSWSWGYSGNREEDLAECDRVDEGMRLFGEYFGALWW